MNIDLTESVFTYHLIRTSAVSTLQTLLHSPVKQTVSGLQHAECMTVMTLGAPIISPARMQLRHLSMFAVWENESAVNEFMTNTKTGQLFSEGWHLRMKFLRRWGTVSQLAGLPESIGENDQDAPVAAVTLARMKLLQVPRFIHWGRPVEKLVRDHPGKSMALASTRLPNTVSTFTIWHSQKEMQNMVFGHSRVQMPKRHADAMKERERKDFHFEFTTLRFKPLSEHGEWQGKTNYLPSV